MQKKIMFAVGLVLFVILFTAGSVVASYYLHSSTTIEDNDIDSEFIVISSSTYTDFLDEVSFDTTVTTDPLDNVIVTYTLNANVDIYNNESTHAYGTDGVNDACLISNALTINVAQTNVTEGYDLTVTVSDFDPIAGLTYIMKVGTAYCTYGQSVANQWTFSGLSFGTNYDVALYVYGTPSVSPGSMIGFTNYDPDLQNPVVGSIFTFLATAPNGAP